MTAVAMSGLQVNLFGVGQRLHIQQGPTDLVIDADGPQRLKLFEAAVNAMEDLLAGLAKELTLLRAPFDALCPPSHSVGRRMHEACGIAENLFVTPMAAVAGAISDHVLSAMLSSQAAQYSSKISVNNGGDIAFWTGANATTHAAIASPAMADARAVIRLCGPSFWKGIATSGSGGRSLSFGIADSVTVLADCAATADVAATLISGAIDCPDEPAIRRLPAHDINPDSDLGSHLVTVEVPPLNALQIAEALDAGRVLTKRMMQNGRIAGAVLELQGKTTLVGLRHPTACLTSRGMPDKLSIEERN